MNSYSEAIDYLYARLPMFTRDGATAINKGLDRTIQFCKHLGNPQLQFKSIHIAGTNGKGSSSNMLVSILEASGYKTGLYTSPHLVDFRERIRVHGVMAEESFVVDFVRQHRDFIEEIKPSFFEVTVAMAFDYFARQKVDIAVIEVGLGGRLDSTNIIRPILSLITNIGMDHTNILGDTLEDIAFEKAGIIKPNTPVVISEYQEETAPIFQKIAGENQSDILFSSDIWTVLHTHKTTNFLEVEVAKKNDLSNISVYRLDLQGSYQNKNLLGVITAVDVLRTLGIDLSDESTKNGLQSVHATTGLQGRWQTLSDDPFIICDTGHNVDGIREVLKNLNATSFEELHIVIGAMQDKDLSHMLPLLPPEAKYYFCAPDMPRAMLPQDLKVKAVGFGLQGEHYPTIPDALAAAKENYRKDDLIFVGGSNFVVAELLKIIPQG